MNIETFVAQMNGDHKESVIQKHIVRQYVPFEKKIAEAKNIVELSCYKNMIDANGNAQKMFWIDSTKKCFITFLAMLRMYTDLTMSEDTLKDYNALAEKKLDRLILSCLPEDSLDFNEIINMVLEDEEENVNSLEGRLKNFLFGFDGIIQKAILQIAMEEEDGKRNVEDRVAPPEGV